ncbi:hypothetical protein [Bacillus cereus]|nr:hypothetical protein [Bacillus cereus]
MREKIVTMKHIVAKDSISFGNEITFLTLEKIRKFAYSIKQ